MSSDRSLTTALVQSSVSGSAGQLPPVYLDPNTVYRVAFNGSDTSRDGDAEPNAPGTQLTSTLVGSVLYPRTTAEAKAGATIVNGLLAPGNVLRYGTNTLPGTTDMKSAFQIALDANNEVHIPDGTYKISSTVTLQPNSVVLGANRAAVIINGPTNTYTFEYLSPLDSAAPFVGMRFENFTLNAKYGIRLNQSGTPAHYGSLFTSYPSDTFALERSLVGPVFRHVALYGTYNSQGDLHSDTNIYPTSGTTAPPAPLSYPSDLIAYGVGLFMAKCFDSYVESSCYFTGHGIAIFVDGSDINLFEGRYQNNARHIHILAHDTYGFSNKITGRDILANRRRGGLFIDGAVDTTISENYFETYLSLAKTPTKDPAGTFITTVGDQNTKILYNRFDQNRIGLAAGSPELDLSPKYGMVIVGNDATYGTEHPGVQIQFRSTNWISSASVALGAAGTNSYLGKFSGNSCSLPPPIWDSAGALRFPVCPQLELDYNNPRLFNAHHPKGLSGSGAAKWPWIISPATGRVVLQTRTNTVNVTFYSSPDDLDILVRFTGRYIAAGGSVGITWGGETVFSGNLGFSVGTEVRPIDITIRRPESQQGVRPVVVILNVTEAEYESVELIPVTFQYGSAPPSTGTWRAGDIIINHPPVVGQPRSWVWVAGSPGRWVSTGNL